MSHETQTQTAAAHSDTEATRQGPVGGSLRDPLEVQYDSGGGLTGSDAGEIAASGASGSGGKLPHFDAIQASFGTHDLSGVSAHTGGPQPKPRAPSEPRATLSALALPVPSTIRKAAESEG